MDGIDGGRNEEFSKKAAVTALVCVTAAGMMTGCGNKKLDGTKTAVTVNKQEIPLGVVSLTARMQQAQAEAMYKMYLGGGDDMSIWSTKMGDDSDETYGENAVTTTVESIEKMCLEKEHASEYDVEITDDEQKALRKLRRILLQPTVRRLLQSLQLMRIW